MCFSFLKVREKGLVDEIQVLKNELLKVGDNICLFNFSNEHAVHIKKCIHKA